jgi:hypothetical protein
MHKYHKLQISNFMNNQSIIILLLLRRNTMYRRFSLIFLLVLLLDLSLTNKTNAELIGWWRLDEGSGTVAFDSGGYGNDARFEGSPTWIENGKLGNALRFNGSSDYIAAPDSESLDINGEQLSIVAWINGEDWPAANHIVRKVADTGTGSIYILRIQPDSVRVYLNTSDGETIIQGTIALTTNEWFHVALTYDGAEARIFVNGELDVSTEVSGELTQSNNELRIGRGEPAGYFVGMIDDVRLYNHALTESELLSVMEGSGAEYPLARGPNPADGALIEDTWANLSWSPGDFAVSHDVYIGDNFDDMDSGAEGTFQGNQTGTFIVVGFPGFAFPDGLTPGTTYYWRIDEVNEAEPNSPWKGDIWSFSVPPKTAYFPVPADDAEAVSVDVELSWTGGFGAKLHTVYFGETFEEVDSATGGQSRGSATFTPGTLDMAKTYYWRVDEFDIAETHKGDIWSFTTEGAVGSPSPAKGEVDVSQTPVLTWTAGVFADMHEVYFSTDPAALELKSSGNLGSESFKPGELQWNTTYYWRIDEANNANADSPWTGPLWSFTTANFLIVDDMESYNDLDPADPASNRIFNAWVDGFDNPAINGSVVGHANAPFAEQTIVHSGNQSMPFAYDNTVGKSEAILTLTSNRDWTVQGVDTLTIWFRGASANAAESLFVALNGGTPVANDDPDAATTTSWTEWNIDLQTFGTNLSNVNTITLGLSSITAGSGMMYFDDIRLYAP